jgi:hypothetical protein
MLWLEERYDLRMLGSCEFRVFRIRGQLCLECCAPRLQLLESLRGVTIDENINALFDVVYVRVNRSYRLLHITPQWLQVF